MGNPRARTGAHDRLQCRDESAGRLLHLDPLATALVYVGFAIGHDDHIFAAKFAVKNGPQGFRRPCDLVFISCVRIGFKFADEPLQVTGDRLEL